MTKIENDETAMCPACGRNSGIVPSLDLVGKNLKCASSGCTLRLEYETDADDSLEFWLESWTEEDERNAPHPDDGFLNYPPSEDSKIEWGKK
jgi:hypothetical protein